MKYSNLIDKVCDQINLRNQLNAGVDIIIIGGKEYAKELCDMFTVEGEVMTHESQFGTESIFCWGESKTKHKEWVDSH